METLKRDYNGTKSVTDTRSAAFLFVVGSGPSILPDCDEVQNEDYIVMS